MTIMENYVLLLDAVSCGYNSYIFPLCTTVKIANINTFRISEAMRKECVSFLQILRVWFPADKALGTVR